MKKTKHSPPKVLTTLSSLFFGWKQYSVSKEISKLIAAIEREDWREAQFLATSLSPHFRPLAAGDEEGRHLWHRWERLKSAIDRQPVQMTLF